MFAMRQAVTDCINKLSKSYFLLPVAKCSTQELKDPGVKLVPAEDMEIVLEAKLNKKIYEKDKF